MNELITEINKLSEIELNDALNALFTRYSQLYPDYEFIFLSLPKNDTEERNKRIQALQKLTEKNYSNSHNK